jgi:hypothetical protein
LLTKSSDEPAGKTILCIYTNLLYPCPAAPCGT